MALLSWKVVHDGKTPPPGEVVRPDERLSWPRTTGIGIQHVLAMFGATFVLPPIMGIPGNTAVFFSGHRHPDLPGRSCATGCPAISAPARRSSPRPSRSTAAAVTSTRCCSAC